MRRDVKGYVKMVKKEQEKLGIHSKKKPVKKEDMPLKKTAPQDQEREI